MDPSRYPLAQLADQVGTPFYLYDAGILRTSLRALADLVAFAPASGGAQVHVRYAMKANSARKVLELVRAAGLWIDAVSGNEVLLNQGTIYASLVRLQERGWISAEWGTSDNNRKAKFYSITKKGRKQLAEDAAYWQRLSDVMGRVLARIARRRRLPLVATNHFVPDNAFGYTRMPDWTRSPLGRLAWRDLNRFLRKADVVTTPTPRAARLLAEHRLGQPVIPISCGVDLERFAATETVAGQPPTVLFVGRLDEETERQTLHGGGRCGIAEGLAGLIRKRQRRLR